MTPLYHFVGLVLVAVLLLRLITRRLRLHSIAHLPGPEPRSWLIGNRSDILRPENVGDAEFAWIKTFGNSVRIKGPFGLDVLFTADPKAFKYVLGTSGYKFPKSPDIRFMLRMTLGKGIIWAEGSQHSRHRKIMEPAFAYPIVKSFLPLFRDVSQRTVAKWRDLIAQSEHTSSVIDVSAWLARLTLDAIGAAAFDYDFGALDEGKNSELAKVYKNLLPDAYHNRSDFTLALQYCFGYFPEWMVYALQRIPTKAGTRLRNYMKVARRVAQSLVDRQLESRATGEEMGKDLMSILVKANLSEDPANKLADDEVLAQMTSLLLAGHDSVTYNVTWALYELSKRPDFQNRVREQIKVTRAQAEHRGDGQLTCADLDSMSYLLAVIKETLRYHPGVPNLTRVAAGDDIIPLSAPLKTKTGEIITQIPVSKGQTVMLSMAAYNRLESVWGEDANVWRPERFLENVESLEKTGLGVFGNIASFSGGVRSCIGWRFAVIETQAILVELIENFQFSPPPGNIEIRRAATISTSPMIKGSDTGRTELPLSVKPVM